MPKMRLSFYDRMTRNTHSDHVPWLRWINDPGTNNLQDTFEGGEPLSVPYGIVDLSSVASYQLGRQVPQSATYTLRGITIAYRPHDDTTTTFENESDAMFAGKVKWYSVTDHAKEMLSLVRQVEQASEEDQVDLDSFLLSTDTDYKALRMNWSSDGDVQYATQLSSELAADLAPNNYWALSQVVQVYNGMTQVPQTNAMFNGRAPGRQAIGWSATTTSGADGLGNANIGHHQDFVAQGLYHEILAGLLSITVEHSSIASQQGLVEDDYQWYIGIDYEVVF